MQFTLGGVQAEADLAQIAALLLIMPALGCRG
jgi:hypothetical protein